MWWLAFCLTVMCLVEQSKLENTDDVVWFNIFSLSKFQCTFLCNDLPILTCEVFEVVSAYGTVGLSLGIPTVRFPCIP